MEKEKIRQRKVDDYAELEIQPCSEWKLYFRSTSREHSAERVKSMQAMIAEWEKTQTVKPLWPSSGNVYIEVNGRWFQFPV